MKQTLLFAAVLLARASGALAQSAPAGANVTDNVNIDGAGTTHNGNYAQIPYGAGNVNLQGDIQFMGSNPWLLHTPNSPTDNRTTLYLAPGQPQQWQYATEFRSNGDLFLKGKLGVGVNPADMNSLRLAVDGTIGAHAVKVTAVGVPWPDYVFSQGYRLRPLREVARYISLYHHLPEVPAAATVAREGLDLAATDALLLRKLEEVTLYLVALQQENEALKARVRNLEQTTRRAKRR